MIILFLRNADRKQRYFCEKETFKEFEPFYSEIIQSNRRCKDAFILSCLIKAGYNKINVSVFFL